MNLKLFSKKLFPFLFNAVEHTFDTLTPEQKNALLQGCQLGQVLKHYISDGYNAIISRAGQQLNLTPTEINDLLTALAKKLSIYTNTPTDFVDKLQAQVNAGMEDSAWDALWSVISGQLAIILSCGSINWPSLVLGLMEYVYQKFIKSE